MKTLKLVGRIIVPVQKSREDGACFLFLLNKLLTA